MQKGKSVLVVLCLLFFTTLATGQIVYASFLHALTICNTGEVRGWGENGNGQLGDNSTVDSYSPVQSMGMTGVRSVDGGAYHSFAIKNDSSLWAWGNNTSGQLGDGTLTQKIAPVQILAGSKIIMATGGLSHSLILKIDGTVWASGYNVFGSVGDGTTINRTNPVQVVGLTGIVAIAAGDAHSIALKNDGTVWSWGRNNYGQLGDSSYVNRLVPVKVKGLMNIIAISGGSEHSIALRNDGTVWSWGRNNYFQLGVTGSDRVIPVLSTFPSGTVSIKARSYASLGLKSDGTVWEAGSTIPFPWGISTAAQVTGISGAIAIAQGNSYSLALKGDGSVWSWGNNASGTLCDGTTTSRTIPAKILGLCLVAPALTGQTTISNVTCYGGNNGSATVTANGGIAPYTYLWSDGQTTYTATNLTAGSYTVTVTDSVLNSYSNTVVISSGISSTANSVDILCSGANTGSIDLSVSGGSSNFSYNWSNGAITEDISGLPAGSYILTLIDQTCADTLINTINITQPAIPLSSSMSIAGTTCGNNNGNVTVTPVGGTSAYGYLWSNGSTTPNISSVGAGTYTVTITDANGCTNTNIGSVSVLTPPVIANISSQTNVLCNLDNNGSATVTVSSGTPGYNYSWNSIPVQTTPTATGLPAGTYIVSITDANSCATLDTAIITVVNPINVLVTASATVVLPGTSVTLSGSGATSFSWTGGITNGVSFIPSATNLYIVTGSDGSGCSDIDSIIVTVLNSRNVISGGLGHSLAVCTSSGVNAWGHNSTGQIGDGTLTERDNPIAVSGLTVVTDVAAGYWHSLALKSDGTVRSWGRNNTGQLGDGTLTQRTTPVIVTGLTGIVSVAGGKEHSMALRNDGTVWCVGKNTNGQLGDGTTIQRTVAVQVSGLTGIVAIAAGYNHSLALKNDGTVWAWGYNGFFQLGSTSASSLVPAQIAGLTNVVGIAAGDNHSLFLKNDGTVWACGINNNGELGDNTIVAKSSPVQVLGLSNIINIGAGMSHSLFVKSDGTVWGCGLNGSGQIGDGSTINRMVAVQTLGLTGINTITGGSAHSLATKNDGTLHAWGLNFTGQIGDGTNLNYRYTAVTVALPCSVAIPLTGTFSTSSSSCSAGTATAGITLTGGILPYNYLWSNGQTTAIATNLITGTYTVTAWDNSGDTLISIISVVNGANVSSVINNVSCFSGNDGIIDMAVTGGVGGFIYQWSNGAGTQDISGLSSGVYTLNFIDTGCNDTLFYSFNVIQPALLGLSVTTVPASCGINNGTGTSNVTGGTPPYNYLWSNGLTTSSVTSLSPAAYSLQITDNNGCVSSAAFNISSIYAAVSSSVSSVSPVCLGGTDGSATVTPASGTGPFTYSWNTSPLQLTQTATNLPAGQYIITVTDSYGCNNMDTVIVNPTPPVPVVANSTATIIIPGSIITLTGSGANTYSWSSGISNGIPFVPSATTTYTVTGTTTAGCSNTSTVTITLKVKHRTIASGNGFSLAICNDSLGQSWGVNSVGMLGNGSTMPTAPTPVQISNLTSITDVAAGQLHAFAILKDGSAYSWGYNNQGELGIGSTVPFENTPQQITALNNVIDIAGGTNFGIALRTDGTVWGWGWNGYGNLGDSTNISTTSPVMIPGFKDAIAVSAGDGHALALKNDGTVWSWGGNNNGELGDSTTISRNYPAIVKGLSNVVDISTFGASCIVVKNDGTVWGWGSGTLFPWQMDSVSNIIQVASGYYFSLMLQNNGTVWSTGLNSYGQLGDGTTISRSFPAKILSLTNVIEITAGSQHALCKKSDNTYWSWGRNWSGALGDGSGVDQYLPVAVAASPSCITAGIEESFQLTDLNIYPNPSNGSFTLEYTGSYLFSFTIINILGEKIREQKLNGFKTELDLSDQPNGIYFIRIESEKGSITKKIILQK